MRAISITFKIVLYLLFLLIGFYLGTLFYEYNTEPKIVETVIYRYPNTPPYEEFSDPIDFNQALILLYGMRASHIQALNWTFESNPGFGIADKDLQRKMIKWYDQLIDYTWRQEDR